jgi:TolB-like protein/Tfp pilus assembly protein PilF
MAIWTTEIKEIEKLYASIKDQLPDLEKELERLIKADDENMILLYSRRCLEVIITDLCECELKRPRKTEPLQGIIDKLHKEGKVPSHIIASMHGLNELSTYGAHPKGFDPKQVRTTLINLETIIEWYLKYKDTRIDIKAKPTEEIRQEIKSTEDVKKNITISRKRLAGLLGGLIGIIASVFAVLYFSNIIGNGKQTKELEKSIAVLPFRNLSNDTTQLYFCDGFMEEILNNLQEVKSFTVRSRTSSDQYRDTKKSITTIGNELNANYLVEGSVGREGNNLRIWIQLIDSKADKHIWSNDYTREMKQIFPLQSEIAKDIATELKAILSPDEIEKIEKKPTQNLDAYNYYLQGNFYYWKSYASQDFKTAIKLYEKAIELDPDFALAYTKIANCLISQYWFYEDRSEEVLQKAKQLIDKAFEIDSDLPEGHLALGLYYYQGYLEYSKALEQLKMVLKEQPRNSEALYYSGCVYRRAGNWEIAKADLLKALELDPRSSRIAYNTGQTFDLLRDYPQAQYYYNIANMLQLDWSSTYIDLSHMFLRWEGDTRKAREILENAVRNNKSFKSDSLIIESNVLIDIYDGKYEEALKNISTYKFNVFQTQWYYKPKNLYYANIYGLMNKPKLEHAYYDSTRIFLEKKIIDIPEDPRLYSSLGIAYAGLGLDKKSISASRKAVELLPIKKEAWKGVYFLEDMACAYVMLGKYDKAIDQIKYLLSIPGILSTKILELDPRWAPLKNQPEFKKILEKYNHN